MSDDIAPEIVSSEENFPTTGPVDSDGGAANQPQATLGEKIRAIGQSALEKTGNIIKRGRGRPRLDGKPKASDLVEENIIPGVPLGVEAENQPENNREGDSIWDGDLLKTCVSGLTKGACHFGKSKLEGLALMRGASPETAERITGKCDITPEEIDAFSQLTARLVKKYELENKYPEETLAGLLAGGIALRFGAAIMEIKKLPVIKP